MSSIRTVLAFDGVGDYINAPNCPALQVRNYTIELWLKPEGQPPITWIGVLGKLGRNFNIRLHQNGSIHHCFHTDLAANANAINTPTNSIIWDRWSHVAITNDGKVAKTYIDGKLVVEGPVRGKLVADNQLMYVARDLDDRNSKFFQGRMANIRIWDRAKSPNDIERIKDTCTLGNELGLVLYWPLSELNGKVVGDRTKNAVAGTLFGGTRKREKFDQPSSPPPPGSRFSGPCTPATALQDIAAWRRKGKKLSKTYKHDERPFRRGRVWS